MEEIYNEDKKTETNQSNLIALQAKVRKIKKDNRIKIDISKTEYPLLRNVSINDLGWKIWTREQSKEQINVYWMDTYIPEEQIRRIKTYQRINHFPSSENLGKKNLLTSNLNRMKKILSKQYTFYPQTFNLPSETQDFQKCKYHQSKFFIVKPGCDSQGRGIYLARCRDLNVKQQMVVQEYIQNPLLIEGMKFDLRIYVLLRSLNPLKIYIYHEGLSRLATCTYQKPSTQNQRNMRMHLTNYAINKFSPNFIFNKSEEEDHVGHKRSYTATMKAIEKLGCDINNLQMEIDKIIVKTIMSTYQTLSSKYKQLRDIKQELESVCFQILGFDILIKDNFEPILLEVNHSPSFATDSPLDLIIKRCLILDTLNMLNLSHDDKVSYLKNKSQHDALHIFPQTSRNNRSIRIQPEQVGAFRKIYPLDNTPENQGFNKVYQTVFKNCKLQKIVHRPTKISPILNRIPFQIGEINGQIGLPKNQSNDNHETSFTLYNVINNLKMNKFKKQKQEQQQKQDVPAGLLEPRSEQKVNIFESDIDASSIRKEELLSYERKIRKDKQKQKKKYVLPMPLNSVSIKLDQKYLQPKRDVRSNMSHYVNPDQNYIKVHSYFNRGFETERTGTKQKGNRTADKDDRLPHFESFRRTHLIGFSHISEDNVYSSELKQKLERMHFVRLRIQKSKKMDKGGYIIVKNKSISKKQSSNKIVNDEGFS